MANLINIDAEVGANMIGDDAQPTLTMENSSTGAALEVRKLAVVSTASIDVAHIPHLRSGATTAVPLTVGREGAIASPTVAVLALNLTSTASAPVFELQNQGFVSCTTILFTTGAVAGTGAIRVKYGDNYGWIPVLPGGSVTAAARG